MSYELSAYIQLSERKNDWKLVWCVVLDFFSGSIPQLRSFLPLTLSLRFQLEPLAKIANISLLSCTLPIGFFDSNNIKRWFQSEMIRISNKYHWEFKHWNKSSRMRNQSRFHNSCYYRESSIFCSAFKCMKAWKMFFIDTIFGEWWIYSSSVAAFKHFYEPLKKKMLNQLYYFWSREPIAEVRWLICKWCTPNTAFRYTIKRVMNWELKCCQLEHPIHR